MNTNTIFDFSVKDYQNNLVSLQDFKDNKAVLVVNVASYWGLTNKNYEELNYLYDKYNKNGLMILGFPCNQFGNQEPKTNEEIQKFIRNKNVRFPIFGKIDVNGKNEDPLYSYLKNNIKGILGKNITWNFTKFLCIYGIPVERYGPKDNPKSFEKTIKDYLDRNDNI